MRISGIYTVQDVKYDLLKIIEPHDGYMYNRKDSDRVKSQFDAFLTDLQEANKIFNYSIYISTKENAVTYDVGVKMHKDRSPKKLKIHVGKLVHFRDAKKNADA